MTMILNYIRSIVCCHVLLFALLPVRDLRAQQRADTLSGTVQSDSGRIIVGAVIAVTRSSDRLTVTTFTDSAGSFRLIFTGAERDYLIHVSADGFTPYRRRLFGPDSVSTGATRHFLDVRLTPQIAQALGTVRVRANSTPPRPSRRTDPGTQVGAAESLLDDFGAAVRPDSVGTPEAMASTLPGAVPTAGGFSVLGLDPQQNTTTLNGLTFAGRLPRAANVVTRVSTTTYDPARGWFGGANTNIEATAGGVFRLRSGFLTIDGGGFPSASAIDRALGARRASGTLSLGGSGPIDRRERFYYSVAAQGQQQVQSRKTLADANPEVLTTLGMSPDSIMRLRHLSHRAGLSAANAGHAVDRSEFSYLARFDYDPRSLTSTEPPRRTYAATAFGSWERTQFPSAGILAMPTTATTSRDHSLGGQLQASMYLRRNVLLTLRSGLSTRQTGSSAIDTLPSVLVTLLTDPTMDGGAIRDVNVGGSGMAARRETTAWEVFGDLQGTFQRRGDHRLSLTTTSRIDAVRISPQRTGSSAFRYASLGDFALDYPSSYEYRTMPSARDGRVWNGFLSIGDIWRARENLRVQSGLRLEANRYLNVDPLRSVPDALVEGRDDGIPNTIGISPRLGFTWTLRDGANEGAVAVNRLGAFHVRPSRYVRGGIGLFRGIMPVEATRGVPVGSIIASTGPTNRCVGPAAPSLSAWASVGETALPCIGDDARQSAWTDSARSFDMVSGRYRAPVALRSNLSYETQLFGFVWSVESTYSMNRSLRSIVDLNFSDAIQFTTGSEGRPVYVPTSVIDPRTGVFSTTRARRNAAIGPVWMTASDGRSDIGQLVASVAPQFNAWRGGWAQLSYVLSGGRELRSGYDGTTWQSPTASSWQSPSALPRHQVVVRGGVVVRGIAISAFARAMSGMGFTPLVDRDVNGDGLANDRALFAASSTSSTDLSTELTPLRERASVRACLDRLAAAPAAREVRCTSGWSTFTNLQFSASPRRLAVAGRVPSIRVFVTNPLAGLDQLVHGIDGQKHWGRAVAPDPVLYHVRGFDPAARTFLYAVNRDFGTTRVDRMGGSGMSVALDVRFDLSPSLPRQQLERYLNPGRDGRAGSRLTADQLRRRYAREVQDPFESIIAESDSLLLSRTQIDSLRAVQVHYVQTMDSVWRALASEFAALPDRYDGKAALRRQEESIDSAREIARQFVRGTLREILDEAQIRLLPGYPATLLRAEQPLKAGGRTFFAR